MKGATVDRRGDIKIDGRACSTSSGGASCVCSGASMGQDYPLPSQRIADTVRAAMERRSIRDCQHRERMRPLLRRWGKEDG